MDKPLPDRTTLREGFAGFRKRMRKPHPDDNPVPPPPEELRYLFRWFQEIACGRPVGGMGTLMLVPAAEISAWCRLRRIQLVDWELDTIRALDAAYVRIMGRE